MNRARKQKLNILIVASMVLTACSGSESSSTSSVVPRTKNAALTAEVADCIPGNVGPNGGFVLGTHDGKIVEGSPTKWTTPIADAVQSQTAAIDYAAGFSLNGKTGWSIPAIEVYQAVKGKIFERYGLSFYWSSTKWGPTIPILMRTNGNPDLKQSYYPSVDVVPLILTPTASAVCSAVPTTTTTSTSTSTTTSTTAASTVPPIATTTTAPFVPVKCVATSLACRIGDTGPGGGVVVAMTEVRSTEEVSIRFTEIAPKGWDGRQDPMEGMRTSALQKVKSYTGGGLSDWRVPTLAESRMICRNSVVPPAVETQQCLDGLGFGGVDYGNNINFVYWTNEKISTNNSSVRSFDYRSGNEWNDDNRTPRIRPARSWDVQRVSLTVPPTATPTTTTTEAPARAWSLAVPKTCESKAVCRLGETGPGGGVIIDVQTSGLITAYVEMAPTGWADANSGQDPLLTASQARDEVAKYKGGGFSDWKIPSELIIEKICHLAAGERPDTQGACVENAAIGKQFGSGKNVRNKEVYWNGVSGVARMKTDFISGRNTQETSGEAYVRPVRSFSYDSSPATTTTTIAKTCAQGGKCAVGDVSPAGNLIVSIYKNGSSIFYNEIASRDWGSSLRPAGNTGDPELIRSTAVTEADNFKSNDSASWHMPSVEEMREVFVFFADPQFDSSCRDTSTKNRALSVSQQPFRLSSLSYWTIDPRQANRSVALETSTGAVYYDANRYMSPWGYKDGSLTMKRGVRPIRTVRYTGPAMDVVPYKWSPSKCETTSPPTTTVTTVPANCVQWGRCAVGDLGPHGGLIIAVKRNVADGPQYTEMEIAKNNNLDCQGTTLVSGCLMREWDDGSFRSPFGFYPSEAELKALASNRSLRSRLNLKPNFYWTSRYVGKSVSVSGDFTGSLSDLAQSLEVEKFEDAVAVSMSNGSSRVTSTAYFRGVIRWNCTKACVGW